MNHNLVIVEPGSTKKVGEASFKMISDPKAGEKNYAPDMKEVLHVIPVIEPEKLILFIFVHLKNLVTIHTSVLSQGIGWQCKES